MFLYYLSLVSHLFFGVNILLYQLRVSLHMILNVRLVYKKNVFFHSAMLDVALSSICLNNVTSSSSSYICHGVGPLVDPFRSHVSRSLFKGVP